MGKLESKIFEFVVVQDFLSKVGGDHAIRLAQICDKKAKSKKPVVDEVIGKQMKDLKITEIRAVLNRLHYRGIAHYQKTRDQNTGWYSYSWGINKKRILELILEEQVEEIGKLEKKIEFEKNYVFFACGKSCENIPFEIAAEYNFKCPNCGGTMNSIDNKKALAGLKKRVIIMKKEIGEIRRII